MFTREELMNIRERARDEARETINPAWRKALELLADAADWCDAQRARSSVEDKQTITR